MGAMFRWMRMLYLFFAAVTRRLVVFPLDGEWVGLTGTALAWPDWDALAVPAGDQIVLDVGDRAVRIYQIDIANPSVLPADYEVRIGYGTLAPDIYWFGPVTYNLASITLPFPLEVPAGERLCAQCRSSVGLATVDVKVLAYTIT